MPVEERRIELSEAEVIAALRLFHLQKDRKDLFDGTIANLCIGMRDDRCFFECAITRDGSRTPFQAGEEVLAAATIHFCSRHNIPLPRKAQKRLEVVDGHLALVLRIGEHERAIDPIPAAAQPRQTSRAGGPQVVASARLNDIKMARLRRELNGSASSKATDAKR